MYILFQIHILKNLNLSIIYFKSSLYICIYTYKYSYTYYIHLYINDYNDLIVLHILFY